MKRLLRSVIDFHGGAEPLTQENLLWNFQQLVDAEVEWLRPEDVRIFAFLRGYLQAQLEMPSSTSVRDYFERLGDVEVTERLKVIEDAAWYMRSNYRHLLETLRDDQRKASALTILKEGSEILTKGMEVLESGRKVTKRGVSDAFAHIVEGTTPLLPRTSHSKGRGDVREDGQAMIDEYLSPASPWGALSGLYEIDESCRGLKPGELHVHAGYAGELKSTFALNWAYNLVTHYRKNVVYISLEMPYEQVRRHIFTIHAANSKWAAQGQKPLDSRKIRDKELSDAERRFYFESVIPDFGNNPNYCTFEVLTFERPSVSMDMIRAEVEMRHRHFDVGFVVIDHGQWVSATRTQKHQDYVIELNAIVRDAKRFALQFAGGLGVPVLLLWQTNRDGKEEADKNDGVYKARALTYSNEVEKAADVITTTYLNDAHRRAGTTKFSNLKNRDNPIVAPFVARIDFPSHRIESIPRTSSHGLAVDDMSDMERV